MAANATIHGARRPVLLRESAELLLGQEGDRVLQKLARGHQARAPALAHDPLAKALGLTLEAHAKLVGAVDQVAQPGHGTGFQAFIVLARAVEGLAHELRQRFPGVEHRVPRKVLVAVVKAPAFDAQEAHKIRRLIVAQRRVALVPALGQEGGGEAIVRVLAQILGQLFKLFRHAAQNVRIILQVARVAGAPLRIAQRIRRQAAGPTERARNVRAVVARRHLALNLHARLDARDAEGNAQPEQARFRHLCGRARRGVERRRLGEGTL